MKMGEFPVKVYIYDLSKGLARAMSRGLLGKQLDGIWHTGIVVYNQEFYYGGMGIESCEPGKLPMLGAPDEICDVGVTQIPFELFMDYLQDLSNTTFRGECYHLLDHNCNTFSNELSLFLTGQPIPDKITSLPQEVLSTPMGALIKPFIDSMQVSPGGQPVFRGSTGAAAIAASMPPVPSTPTSSASTADPSTPPAQPTDCLVPLVVFKPSVDLVKMSIPAVLQLSEEDHGLLKESLDFVTAKNSEWSIGRPHVALLCKLLKDEVNHQIACDILLQAVREQDIVMSLQTDQKHQVMSMVLNFDDLGSHQQVSLLKVMCNICLSAAGRTWVTDKQEWSCDSKTFTNTQVSTTACVTALLSEDKSLSAVGSCFAHCVTQEQLETDTAVELGGALIQTMSSENIKTMDDHSACCLVASLLKCTAVSGEVAALAGVMGLDLTDLKGKKCDKLTALCGRLQHQIESNTIG